MKNFILVLLLIIGAISSNTFAAKITSDLLKVGKPGSSADKVLKLGDTREIRANETSGKLEFTNDGAVYKAIGAGEGGSSGGVNDLQNPGFEDGITTNWTSSAGDTSQLSATGCTLGTDCPLVGETSLRFSPDAQNDFFESALFSLSEANYGRACEARIFYVGGDDQLEAQIINGDLETIATLTLKAHSQPDFESVFFLCPTKAEVVADADKGNLKIKINNTGASAAASADFDDLYGGNLIGLVETQTPDVFGAAFTDQGVTISESSDFIQGDCTRNAAGDYSCSFVSGLFSVAPSCVISTNSTGSSNPHKIDCRNVTSSGFDVFIMNASAGSGVYEDNPFSVQVVKQGADAKQSVQVYKSIPKVAQNENVFSAKWTGGGAVQADSENVDWINGDCTNNGTGDNTCDFQAGIFTSEPNCLCTVENSGVNVNCTTNVTSTQIQTTVFQADTGAALSRLVNVTCEKSGPDYRTPTVQPILVKQVETTNEKGIRTESCRVDNNGTATINTASGMCESWIESVTRTAAGIVDVIYLEGVFSSNPVCVVNATNSNNNHAGVTSENFGLRRVTVVHEALPTTNSDGNFYISCKGKR